MSALARVVLPTLLSLSLCACHSAELDHATDGVAYSAPEDTGDRQSPVNILLTAVEGGGVAPALAYDTSPGRVVNTGHTVKVEVSPGCQARFGDEVYELKQFHFHTPSEHQLDGVTYPLELHAVHTLVGDPEAYLVVGVLFKEGAQSEFLARFLNSTPDPGAGPSQLEVSVDLRALYTRRSPFLCYEGSLTTPPYTESVHWLILNRVHQASPEQIKRLNGLEGNNARHIQELHGRTVRSSS
jgi:carbonic anhydrase